MDNEFNHHGIKGMRWGVRRYQNEDGSLTSAGKKRYKSGDHMNDKDPSDSATTRRVKKDYNSMTDLEFRSKYQTSKETYRKRVNRYGDPYMNSPLTKLGKSLAKSQTLSKIANSEGQRKRAEKLRDTLVKKAARASTKEMYKKLKRGEVLKGFDETTGQFLGFVDRKTGEPIKYSDVAAAQTYGAKKQAAAYIAAAGVLTVASVMAKLQE